MEANEHISIDRLRTGLTPQASSREPRDYALTSRWTSLRAHPVQKALWRDPVRFKVVPAGRRSGKTELAKRRLVKALVEPKDWANPRYAACAPTRDQAKRIYWADFKRLVPSNWIDRIVETELSIQTRWGAELQVLGMDKPERIEGSPWDGVVLDEYANMKPIAWSAHTRPALSDRLGWAWMIGVPEGRNHYYDLYSFACDPANEDWQGYTWFSSDILPASEIEAAKRELDPATYQQEYEAAFVAFQGLVYYPFNRNDHVRPLPYDAAEPLWLCLDFNVSPGVAAILQEKNHITGVIDEIHIPRHSNTPTVINEFLTRYRNHKGPVRLYGDATGGARGTAQIAGTDWEIARSMLRPVFPNRISARVPKSNPAERARINAVNSRLKSASGDVRLIIDPKCTNVIKDFEGVRVLEGTSGEIDKKSDPTLTHLTDAIGYAIEYEHPVSGGGKARVVRV